MAHGLAEQSGGRLTLESEPGHGTRIDLWLPVAASVGTGGPAPEADARAGEPAAPRVVLAVDDDPLVLTNTAAMLEDLGHTVIAVGSAREALAALETQRVDLVITDHAMPQMTGHELAEQIRLTHPELPVVLATGYAELPPGVGETLARLAKPYSQAELARLLRDVLTVRERPAA